MNKHTPGPWAVYDRGWHDCRIVQEGCQETMTIATMGDWKEAFRKERDANARLIASAPDLLEALRLAEATLDRLAPNGTRATQGTRDVITAALNKAGQ